MRSLIQRHISVTDPPVHQRTAYQCHDLLRRERSITHLYERALPAGGSNVTRSGSDKKTTHLGLGNKTTQ